MTLIPQRDCCTMLGIGPKTLRHWLRHANMQFSIHPTDARLKCLMLEQVQQLATLHARPIAPLAAASPGLRQEATPLPSTLSPPSLTQQNETPLADAPASFSEEAGLRTVVCGLEAKVMALQEQLAQLTLELLRERSERYERRLSSLEALLSLLVPLYWSIWPVYRLSRGAAELESLSLFSWSQLQTVSWHHRSSDDCSLGTRRCHLAISHGLALMS